MPRSFAIALIVLVVAPLVLLGWLMSLTMRNQRIETRQRLTVILESRLQEMDQRISARLQQTQRQILQTLAESSERSGVDLVGHVEQQQPAVRRGLWLSRQNVLVYPSQPLSDQSESVALYAGLKRLVLDRRSPNSEENASAVSPPSDSPPAALAQAVVPQKSSAPAKTSAVGQARGGGKSASTADAYWQVWYFDQGLQLILWLPQSDGSTIGFLLERGRWLADLISVLPDTQDPLSSEDDRDAAGYTVLVDSSERVVYRWGLGTDERTPLAAEIPVSDPLSAWRLRYYSDLTTLATGPFQWGWIASLLGVGVLLLTLGGYIATGVSRQMRAARQRVSFAGQVSHELRTPLTNIRLYAELAEADISQLPASVQRDALQNRLQVIEGESQRLTRLVSGVLEWVSEPGRRRPLRLQPVCPDEVIDQAIEQFRPSFAAAELSIQHSAAANRTVPLDVDIIELILVNLLSNVEKYASQGESVEVRSEFRDGSLRIVVHDQGPGIPSRQHQHVFKPFARLDDSVSAPSGTGIGLSIARTAARRHGGELRLLPQREGACFELTIPVSSLS
ncbi:sensor histidine kinase [Roseimaritima ulvae]|uniref:histidine kinase n=1 Tax=Roseimaritima ulvae TaxID=980254 RepID=A0A5B9QNM9_9BACT|nr:HAMP domain-containing sensor histidine kinase [Roseimaritima ulvae]QEG39502.1 Signal-transduction histidine kinase senX3 [Roseimaritima ulvae]